MYWSVFVYFSLLLGLLSFPVPQCLSAMHIAKAIPSPQVAIQSQPATVPIAWIYSPHCPGSKESARVLCAGFSPFPTIQRGTPVAKAR